MFPIQTGFEAHALRRMKIVWKNRMRSNAAAHRRSIIVVNKQRTCCGSNDPPAKSKPAAATNDMRQLLTTAALVANRHGSQSRAQTYERIDLGNCAIPISTSVPVFSSTARMCRSCAGDILTSETADPPAKLVYLAVQLMYISSDLQTQHGTYFNLVREIMSAVPSSWPIIEGIKTDIMSADLYRALKEARKLIAYEAKLKDQYDSIHPKDVSSAA